MIQQIEDTRIDYAREPFSEALANEARPLIEKNWEETSHRHDIPLKPDMDKYKTLDERGFLAIFTARKKGALVGYCVMLVSEFTHSKDKHYASQDVVYISPEHRGFGPLFINWCDGHLKRSGVSEVFRGSSEILDCGPLLERIGYKPVSRLYSRRLS